MWMRKMAAGCALMLAALAPAAAQYDAALAQSLVAHIDRLDDEGAAPRRQRDWILNENKWRAGRHGLDASLIVDDEGGVQPARAAIAALVEAVRPDAVGLGCEAELDGIAEILEHGSSADRQRRVADGGTNLWAVVDQLARELSSGVISR